MRKKKATQDKDAEVKKGIFKVERKKEKKPKEKKTHDKGYILKKNIGMRVLRVLLWIILVFIFVRGIVAIFNSDKEAEMKRLIADFKVEYGNFTNQNNEVMAFAQNFVREYLTYEIKGEEDYKNRLKPYVSKTFLNDSLNDFKNSAAAVYVQAYRMEEYSPNQVDVYVLAEVEYYSRTLDNDAQSYVTNCSRSQIVLNVPVYISAEQSYVVENIPLPVTDSVYLEEFGIQEYSGTGLEDTTAIKTSIENFLKAYFEQDESVINYYLDIGADKEKFSGLKGRFTFLGIDDLKCYQEPGADITCLVEFNIKDISNDAKLLQKINLSVRESGGKYYIKSMGTRTGNLNFN